MPHSISVIKDKLFHIQKQLFKKQKAKLVFLVRFFGQGRERGSPFTQHSAPLMIAQTCTHAVQATAFSEIHPTTGTDLHFTGIKIKKENSYPITLYQKNQTVYPAGHPGNRSPLNLFFISWYSSETSSCLTSPAVVLRVRLGFVLFFAKAER